MKIFPVKTAAKIDEYTIVNEPVLSINLMERAAQKIFTKLKQRYTHRTFIVLAGKGNNGGDALAIARMLLLEGFDVTVILLSAQYLSPDAAVNLERLRNISRARILEWSQMQQQLSDIADNCVIVDGLFGSGLNRPLFGDALNLVRQVNKLTAEVVSIDIPSGLMGENNNGNNRDGIIEASIVYTLQFPKLSFLFPENNRYVQQWEVINIGLSEKKTAETPTGWYITEASEICSIITARTRFDHKGIYGHALLIAGSYSKMGAAALSAKACLRSGAGLLTVHVPQKQCAVIHTSVPEAITSIDRSELMFTEFPDFYPFAAVGVGPAIGTRVNTVKALSMLLYSIKNKPLVMDADAINIIAQNPDFIAMLPHNTVLTPHPKEFERLVGKWSNDYERLQLGIEFCMKQKVILVLKGAFTTVILSDGTCHFNPTGNPGMATAGSGDVLTGIILGLLSQGLHPECAAIAGVYLHGLAGDIAAEATGEEAMIASDITEQLGGAFKRLRMQYPQSSSHKYVI